MDEYCPLCRKMGNYKKIRAIQVNYDEAVWLCEDEKCPWPFGFEEFKFIPRNFQLLSKKPAVKTELRKHKESTSISTELGLYTPPVTPSNETSSKDASKVDNLSLTSSNSFNSNYDDNGKMSPKCASSLVSIAPLKKENHVSSNNPRDEKLSKSISSIFDIDSSLSVCKNDLTSMKREAGSIKCDNKLVKAEVEPKNNATMGKNTPQIRCIESFPNSLIKIEVIEQMTSSIASDKSEDKRKGRGCVGKSKMISPRKRPSIAIENKDNSIDGVPKKVLNISNERINENIVKNESFTLNDNLNSPYNCVNHVIDKETNLQSNYSGILNFDSENNLIENSGQVNFGLNGILDEMLLGDCQNASQEIDDDWLNSMLL